MLSNPEKGKWRKKGREKTLSRRDRSPCRRRTPPSLQGFVSACSANVELAQYRTLSLLLLSGGSVASGVTAGSGSTTSSGGSTTTGADVQEQVLDILALESLESCIRNPSPHLPSIANAHLGEKGGPDGLNLLDLCGLDQRLELVGLQELALAHTRMVKSSAEVVQ